MMTLPEGNPDETSLVTFGCRQEAMDPGQQADTPHNNIPPMPTPI
jgi:hypothetical protein